MLFFLLINVKMPTVVGILTFVSEKVSYSAELSFVFRTSGPGLTDCLCKRDTAEHEILNTHKSIKKSSIFQAQVSLECYFLETKLLAF